MLKKSLLAGIAFISLTPTQAGQSPNPQYSQSIPHHENPGNHGPAHHPQNLPHHEPVQQGTPHHASSHPGAHPGNQHCPCNGTGGKRAWVLIEANEGCTNEGEANAPEPHHRPQPHHTPAEGHHIAPHHPASLHPSLTPEEEKLSEELKPIAAHIFRRADPHNPHAEKRGESGKALHGKVYFQRLGKWEHDPSVHATTDIISTGVRDRVRMLNEQGGKQQHPETPTPSATEAAPKAGTQPVKSWPKVNVPDALGTTQGRIQSAYTNPTENNERQFGLGAPNRAQTGVTGRAIPEADASESRSSVPPPPPPMKAERN